jgi:hypothetical protein
MALFNLNGHKFSRVHFETLIRSIRREAERTEQDIAYWLDTIGRLEDRSPIDADEAELLEWARDHVADQRELNDTCKELDEMFWMIREDLM